MSSRSKSFLGRNRNKQQQVANGDTEFDPTTFRKNRTRPARKGQDALYGEYEDLFDDSLDEDLNEDSLPSDGGADTDEDGYLMLRGGRRNGGGNGGGGNGGGNGSGGESPVSPRTRVTPRSVPMQDDMRYNGSLSPPPPAPPPKNWTQKRSLVVVTTPPRSAPASVDEPLTISVTSLPSAPPTPPPKPILFALDTKNLTITTIHNGNYNHHNKNQNLTPNTVTPSSSLPSAQESEETINGFSPASSPSSPASSNPPPHRPAPDVPHPPSSAGVGEIRSNRSKRLSRQFLEQAEKGDGLGIIRIPSPTLFHSLFTPSASSSGLSELPGHTTRSPALTQSPSSYTPRQPPPHTTAAYETLPSDDDFIPTGILFDETPDGLGVLPLFSSRSENFSPRHQNKNNNSTSSNNHHHNNSDSYFPPQTPQMTQVILNELPPESPGDVSASTTTKSIDALMDAYMETTDTYKEVQIRVAEDDKDAKEAILQSLAPEVVTTSMVPTPAEEKILLLDEQQDDATKDSSYLRAFRTFVKSAGENDSFVHRMPRFDALQAQRICSHLRQDYPLIAGGSKRRSAGGKATGGNVPAKQREVGEEILTSLWALMALRWMNFGRVIISPGHETLLAASAKRLTRRATVKMDQRATQMLENVVVESVPDHERRRVLDLGGLPIADWGWHCAYDYPKAKVYTVTTRTHGKSSVEDPESQDTPLSADKYRGPKNHRHLVVSYLWKLPFPSNHFDVVSARTLYLNLKTTVPSRPQNDQNMDEYDLCLEECLRVLKPGGHLEFTLFDNDIINPGPLGSELSEKFGKSLQAKGYDPEPTKKWISRLNRAGYGEIKRSWMFLPMAPPCSKPKVPSKDKNLPAHESQDLDMVKEEVRKKMEAWEEGSTKKGSLENASPITGLVGSWIWEKWMLKTSNEAGEGEWSLATDTVGSVLNEAKERGSGWRTLVGWARKPLRVGQH